MFPYSALCRVHGVVERKCSVLQAGMNVICFNLIRNVVNWSLLNSGVNLPSGALLSTNTLRRSRCEWPLCSAFEERRSSTAFSAQS